MLEKLKWYAVTIGAQKYLPVAIMAAFGAAGTYLAAHAGMLEQYGVTFGQWPFVWPAGQEPSGSCILIELDTLSAATLTAVAGLAAVAIRAAQHHSTGSTTVAGGQRAGDPPKPQEEQK